MPQSQDELLTAIANLLQRPAPSALAAPVNQSSVEGTRSDFLEGLNKYTSIGGRWLQEPFLGTTPTLDLASHLNSAFAQHYFTGKLSAAQIQAVALHAQSMLKLPGAFMHDVLQTIGYTVDFDSLGNYLPEPKRIEQGFRPWNAQTVEPYDVPQG